MRKSILIITLSILFFSCGQDENKQKELELKEKELALKQRELDLKEKESNIPTSKDSITKTATNESTTTSTSTSLSDDEILKFIKKDFSKERNDEQLPSPSVSKVFLLDYNNDGLKDGVAYAIGSEEGAKFSFNGFGLYKNENGKMRLMDWKVSSLSNLESVQQSGNNVIVKAVALGPNDPQCCPSIKKTMTLSFSNDKIKGLQ